MEPRGSASAHGAGKPRLPEGPDGINRRRGELVLGAASFPQINGIEQFYSPEVLSLDQKI
jgi:hypothetical protein